MSTASAGGEAFNAGAATGSSVAAGQRTPAQQEYLDTYADECERAVEVIAAKLAGVKETLATARVEAKRARAEARNGGEQ